MLEDSCMNITLERLQHADINLLRELRNVNADAFFDSDTYITKEDQEDWWYCYERQSITNFYTIWLNKVTPVGFLSVTWRGEHGMAGITAREIGHLLLAPARRGRGIMHAAVTEVRRLYDPLTFWLAHVKPGNTASLALFDRQGFVTLPRKRNRQCHSPKSRKPTNPSSPTC